MMAQPHGGGIFPLPTFNRAHGVLSGAWLPSKVSVLAMDFLLHGIRAISFPLHMLYVLMRCRLALTASPCHPSQGSVDLPQILPPDIARRYATPNPDLFRPVGEVKLAHAVVLTDSPEDYIKIVRRMFEIGMVAHHLLRHCQVRRISSFCA